ncbi:MAG: porphobilinogen synthase, partial [Thermoguttaceae bacterium]|nr:porphobilinogen synthase [Thermoguttaceae bacterium]
MAHAEESHQAGFPTVRMRRLRYHPGVRDLVRETNLSPRQMILPLFVRPGEGVRQEIGSMPGHYQLSPDRLADEAGEASRLGLGGVILFGIPAAKDATGSGAVSPDGIVPQAIRAAKQAAPDLLVIT